MTNRHLETERLIIRPFEETDLDITLEMNTNPEVMKFLDGVLSHEENLQKVKKWSSIAKIAPYFGVWVFIRKDDNRKLGIVGLFQLPLEDNEIDLTSHIEIGYRSIPEAWGKGYTTEAAMEVMRYGFHHTDILEITACTAQDNIASQSVLQKIALKPQGDFYCYGADLPFFLARREEWLADHG